MEVVGRCFDVVLSCSLGALALEPPERFRPRSPAACVLSMVSCYKLQNNLQMATTSAELECAQEKPSCKLKLAVESGTT